MANIIEKAEDYLSSDNVSHEMLRCGRRRPSRPWIQLLLSRIDVPILWRFFSRAGFMPNLAWGPHRPPRHQLIVDRGRGEYF